MVRIALLTLLVACLYAPDASANHNSVEIHACWKIRSGDLRLAGVDSAGNTSCRINELPITWAVQGPVGPPGKSIDLEPVSCQDPRNIGCCALVAEE